MTPQADPALISALVVLRAPAGPPSSGQHTGTTPSDTSTSRRAAATENITTENLARSLPDPSAARTVSSWFSRHGFTVTDTYATSFTILGPPTSYESVFGAAGRTRDAFPPRTRLPVHRLPPEIAALVDAVGTPRQPDFGPTP